MSRATPEIDVTKCTGCGDCVKLCPVGAVGLVNGKAALVDGSVCYYCTDCETVCHAGAIKCPFEIILVTKGTEPEIKDNPWFDITFSGE